jgi:hypothetical protein
MDLLWCLEGQHRTSSRKQSVQGPLAWKEPGLARIWLLEKMVLGSLPIQFESVVGAVDATTALQASRSVLFEALPVMIQN